MMNRAGKDAERGQALVLIVLAIVAMFGFAALAVDLGRVYAERRRAQNAADAAAYAAAYAGAMETDATKRADVAKDAAVKQLQLNGFVDPNDVNQARTDPEQTVDATVNYVAGSAGSASYYEVTIDARVDQVFSQFVYRGPLRITAKAVVEAAAASGAYEGDALHATSKTACRALNFNGAGDVNITGGDAFSDSVTASGKCGRSDPASCNSGIKGGSGYITLDDGHSISTVGEFDPNGQTDHVRTVDGSGNIVSSNLADIAKECQTAKKTQPMPTPHCGPAMPSLPNSLPKGQTELTLYPGTYTDIAIGYNVKLMPGLYCITGTTGIKITGGTFTGNGVMFYMDSNDNSIEISGKATVTLTSPASTLPTGDPSIPYWGIEPGNTPYQWGGMLIYMPINNTGKVQLGGSSGSNYSGTIYAPGPPPNGNDKCILIGNSTGINDDINFTSSVICSTIKVDGGAVVNIHYDQDSNFHFPPNLSLSQ